MVNDPMPQVAADPAARATASQFSWQLSSTPHEVRRVLSKATKAMCDFGVNSDDRITAELVLAEVLNNVVEHAYAETDNGLILVGLALTGSGMTLTVTDNGHEMPGGEVPPKRPSPPPNLLDQADLPEGGWGWQVIHDCASTLTYQRKEDTNRLQITLDAT